MRRLIRTDGTVLDLPDPIPIGRVGALIGAATLDTVTLRHLGSDPIHVMLVDDHGYDTQAVHHPNGVVELKCTNARKPVNEEATRLYWANCLPGTTHQIVGDVVVVPDSDYGHQQDDGDQT